MGDKNEKTFTDLFFSSDSDRNVKDSSNSSFGDILSNSNRLENAVEDNNITFSSLSQNDSSLDSEAEMIKELEDASSLDGDIHSEDIESQDLDNIFQIDGNKKMLEKSSDEGTDERHLDFNVNKMFFGDDKSDSINSSNPFFTNSDENIGGDDIRADNLGNPFFISNSDENIKDDETGSDNLDNPFFTSNVDEDVKEDKDESTSSDSPFFSESSDDVITEANPLFLNTLNLIENDNVEKKVSSINPTKSKHFNVKIVRKKDPLFKVILGVISYAIFIWLLLVGIVLLIYVLDIKIRASKGDYSAPTYNAYVVLTGSMLPKIQIYDVVVTKKVDASSLEVGDVITFASADSRFLNTIITHRIIKKSYDKESKTYSFQTKGDNNNVADNALVPQNNIYGKVILKIPKLGYLQEFLATDGGWIIVILIPCLVVISYDTVKIVKGLKKKKYKNIKVQKQMIGMKTNNFRVKEKKEKKIIIEEDRTDNPLLLFFRRHRKFLLLLLISILVCMFLVSVGIVFSLFMGSNDYDISYVNGSEEISSNNDPDIDDADIKEGLLGEVARAEGVVVLVETFMSNQGDVISYYTDGTAVIVQSNGNIYRVSALKDGSYGVNKNGKIDSSAKKILVTSTTSTLSDGTVVTYYSDGTAKVQLNEETIFVRDSNNIKLKDGDQFSFVSPSGVALTKNTVKVDNSTIIFFTDGVTLVITNNQKILVNKNITVSIDSGVSYDKNNTFSVIGEQTLKDGNTITHYSNGSATITDSNGNVIYVKKAGDIILKDKKLYEIITNQYGFSRSVVNCPDGRKVVYFDNGAAIIIQNDGSRQYVVDNTEILYDSSKNISSNPSTFSQIAQRKTSSGEQIIDFENGKSQVIKSDGTSYIINTDQLIFSPSGEITRESTDVSKNSQDKDSDDDSDDGDIYVSEAENKYNKVKNIEDTTFMIRNDSSKSKKLRITIEEISNYNAYQTKRLDPKYVKFQATIGDEYVPASRLVNNIWRDGTGKVNYVIYEGKLNVKEKVTVALSLYVDYAELTNDYQNTGFIGTIHIYVEG